MNLPEMLQAHQDDVWLFLNKKQSMFAFPSDFILSSQRGLLRTRKYLRNAKKFNRDENNIKDVRMFILFRQCFARYFILKCICVYACVSVTFHFLS